MSGEFFTLVIVPLLILVARIIDVTLGTIRMVFISKGEKFLSASLGFFEVLIWLLAITRIMDNLTNVWAYLAYASGFAIGTYLGMVIEQKLLVGKVVVDVITSKDAQQLVEELREKKYTFTCIGVDGPESGVKSLHVIIHKKDLNKLIHFITAYDPDSYYTVEDIKIVTEHKFTGPVKTKEPAIVPDKAK
jgi:uncharacterized protein YebE (UPF0316 family)